MLVKTDILFFYRKVSNFWFRHILFPISSQLGPDSMDYYVNFCGVTLQNVIAILIQTTSYCGIAANEPAGLLIPNIYF